MPHLYDDCGGAVSLRSPKLTKRLKSENTSRLSPVLEDESDPVGGPLMGGEPNALKIPSAALELLPAPESKAGRLTRLPAGLMRLTSC